jgi:2-hydroxychromene-2-carboxylate isomerase
MASREPDFARAPGSHCDVLHDRRLLRDDLAVAYVGHERFAALARPHGARVRVRPAEYGRIFPIPGGLPLAKRAPQRQAYRLVELTRLSEHLGLPLNLQPQFFPPAGDDAARRG